MDDQNGTAWRILSSTYPVRTAFLRLRCDVVALPDGTIISDYFVRETNGFCVILALTLDRRVVLVRQYKHGAGERVLELPAGGIDDGEAPSGCAVRELAEETGYAGTAPELVRTFLADPTNSNGRFHVYVIRDAVKRGETAFDPTEDITVELTTPAELRTMAGDGRINSGSQVAAVYAALDYLD